MPQYPDRELAEMNRPEIQFQLFLIGQPDCFILALKDGSFDLLYCLQILVFDAVIVVCVNNLLQGNYQNSGQYVFENNQSILSK